MKKTELKKHFMRLYEKYGVSMSIIENLTELEIAKGAKGYLATLTNERIRDFDESDIAVIKDISFYFC